MRLVRLYNHISLGYAGGGGGGGGGASEMNTCREPCGWFDLDHVSTSSIPSIVLVVEGGNGVDHSSTLSAVLAWCYDGTRYYKPATNATA